MARTRLNPNNTIYINRHAKALRVDMPVLEYDKMLKAGDSQIGSINFDEVCVEHVFVNVDSLPPGQRRKVLKRLKMWTEEDETAYKAAYASRSQTMKNWHWKHHYKPTTDSSS